MKQLVIFVLCLLMSCAGYGQCHRLADQIDKLTAKRLPNADVGMVVMDGSTGAIIYERNAYQAFSPASNMKLLTAAAALYALGPDYRYHTQLAWDPSQVTHHTLQGNVYMRFSGDPTLTINKVQHLMQQIKARGIHTINGDIVIDHSLFTKPNYPPGSTYDNSHWYYGAPISAILINQNALTFHIHPSDTLGQRAHIQPSSPARTYANLIENDITTVSYQKAMHRCSLILDVNAHNAFQLKGCWPIGDDHNFKLAIKNPYRFASGIIRHSLKVNNIKLSGQIKQGHKPSNLTSLTEQSSPELKAMLTTMMKHSNNIYAESLFKTLGVSQFGKGSFQLGGLALQKVLADKAGLDFQHARIKDGAGESRYDLITPMMLARVLYVIDQDSHLGPIYRQTLPDSGADGTLKKRMTSADMKQVVQAKTGSMTGVSTLSGYIKTLSSDHLIFSIMVNHLTDSLTRARNFQDQALMLLRRYNISEDQLVS